jgi:GNAT superfamily N-acetyltransferase
VVPDPFDVLEATLGPAVRVLPVGSRRILRTTERPDHLRGNAVHRVEPLSPDQLGDALVDLAERFPTGRARLVVPWSQDLADAASSRQDVTASPIEVLERQPASRAGRGDLRLSVPTDDRAWHGITVLQRHAGPSGEDRARGAADERLRWWTDQLRQLQDEGRARVLRAERFGTPVAFGVLHWAPGLEVGPDHAGLAVVAGVTVHPAHRNLSVARTLVGGLVTRHLADFPRARVTAVVEGAGRAGPPTGWERHARLLAVTPA